MASVIDEFKKQEETSFSTMLQEKKSIFGNVMNLTKDLLSFGKSALNVIQKCRGVIIFMFWLSNFNPGNQRECE